MSLEISQEKTFGLRNFQKHLFYRTLLDDCFWLFRATLLKWSTANNVWKNSDEYSLPRNANLRSTANNGKTQMNIHYLETLTLEVPFRYIISFSAACKLSVYVYIGLHCLLPKAAIRVEVFCKKGVLKDFVNFIGKHLCWSLFLINLQA